MQEDSVRLSLVAVVMLSSALAAPSLAQTLVAIPQGAPGDSAAPAADLAGSSDQDVTAAGGAVDVSSDTYGSLSGGTSSSPVSGSGTAGASVNDVGVSVGGAADASLPDLPSPSPGVGGAGAGDAPGGPGGPSGGTSAPEPGAASGEPVAIPVDDDGNLDPDAIAAAREAVATGTCMRAEFPQGAGPDTAAQIDALDARDRIALVMLCEADRVLSAEQEAAIAANAAISAVLSQAGFGVADVVAIRLGNTSSGTLYIRAGRNR